MKVAAIQMVSGCDVPSNLQVAAELLEEAARQGAELAVLPEFFCLMGHQDTDKLAVQEAYGQGPVQQFLADRARSLGLWLVGGTLPLATPDPQRVHNTTLVFSPQGLCVARYDKLHLFRLLDAAQSFDETRVVLAGVEPAQFTLVARNGQRWTVGLSICYDLRFPELYRWHAAQGADLLLVPRAFTHAAGQAHVGQHGFGLARAFLIRQAADAQRHGHVIERAELGQQVMELVDKAQVLVAQPPLFGSRSLCQVLAMQVHAARRGRIERAHQVQERALARARGAHNGQRLARVHVQVHALEHGHVEAPFSETFGQATHRQHHLIF